VVQWATEALDEVRREAWRSAQKKAKAEPKRKVGRPPKEAPKKETTAKDLKGSRFALSKAPENLTEKQEAQLVFIAKSDKKLYRAYLLKEKLRLVFQCRDADTAQTELDAWIKWAQHCRIKVFVELQRKIRRHYDAILATMEYHLTNAAVEATNRKIKLSIYMAYGFRNMDNMLDMIMLRCSDIEVRLPWEYEPVLPATA
jgi:transposase